MTLFFLLVITGGFLWELLLASPVLSEVLRGFVPSKTVVTDPKLLYITIGIVGATVMPHNLYLHSHLVKRRFSTNKRQAIREATANTVVSLAGAMLLNAALVVLAASVFHRAGLHAIADIAEAHHLLTPLLGTSAAAMVFAIMLLAAGQSATLTGTLAGQVVMSGFVRFRMPPWKRRLFTRLFALIPALFVILYVGENSVTWLLVGSQVFLSLQLPFAMVALLLLAADKTRMGEYASGPLLRLAGWGCAVLIIAANTVLVGVIVWG